MHFFTFDDPAQQHCVTNTMISCSPMAGIPSRRDMMRQSVNFPAHLWGEGRILQVANHGQHSKPRVARLHETLKT